jgi:hypothetical protein
MTFKAFFNENIGTKIGKAIVKGSAELGTVIGKRIGKSSFGQAFRKGYNQAKNIDTEKEPTAELSAPKTKKPTRTK